MKATILLFSLAIGLVSTQAANGLWTNPSDSTLPVDFKIQGEYVGKTSAGNKLGAQVIALGGGKFQAILLPGGLPGAGWDGKNKSLLEGWVDEGRGKFKAASGKRRYLAKTADEFSATRKFPPTGHRAAGMTTDSGVAEGHYTDGETFRLKRVVRKSGTLGKKPPKGAIVLFDGSNKNEWTGGRVDAKTGLLNTDGKDIRTRRKFNNYHMHIEFLLPYKPAARGQGRGNSGFYQVDDYEVQVLDSFGLEGLNNECGGIYSKRASDVNACLPPLQWQTYDVDFTNAVVKDGRKLKNTLLTIRLNGIVIHNNIEIDSKCPGSRGGPEGRPGPIRLQGHNNPLQFRNIWIVEK